MGIYSHKHILTEYANSRMTVAMAMGHTLQHIAKLHKLQADANANRYALRGRVDTLEQDVAALRSEIARLTARLRSHLSRSRSGASS